MNIFPLTQSESDPRSECFDGLSALEAPILPEALFFKNFARTREGSKMCVFRTSILDGTSDSRLASMMGTSGFEGVNTTGVEPSLSRLAANLSHRWTPPPPEGGQYFLLGFNTTQYWQ